MAIPENFSLLRTLGPQFFRDSNFSQYKMLKEYILLLNLNMRMKARSNNCMDCRIPIFLFIIHLQKLKRILYELPNNECHNDDEG